MTSLAEFIQEKREKAGYSIYGLADRAALSIEVLEDIEYDDRSEVRKMIDKFVDENPAAVAQLLRNWLNEDWE